MRACALGLLLLTTGGCAHRFVECNDTETCRAQRAERERQFAERLREEPPSERVGVERVSPEVLVDRAGGLVYALDPGLVGLELATGAERWRVPELKGRALWRVGRFLVVEHAASKHTPPLSFVDPAAPAAPRTCAVKAPAPPEATTVRVHPFDQGGQAYVYWVSSLPWEGGTPPSEEHERRAAAAEGCGVVRIDPATCAVSEESLADFVWDPPEGRRRRPGEPEFCSYLSPLHDLPAAAASEPPAIASSPASPALRIKPSRMSEPGACLQVSRLDVEAVGPAGEVVWAHRLEDRELFCGPP